MHLHFVSKKSKGLIMSTQQNLVKCRKTGSTVIEKVMQSSAATVVTRAHANRCRGEPALFNGNLLDSQSGGNNCKLFF